MAKPAKKIAYVEVKEDARDKDGAVIVDDKKNPVKVVVGIEAVVKVTNAKKEKIYWPTDRNKTADKFLEAFANNLADYRTIQGLVAPKKENGKLVISELAAKKAITRSVSGKNQAHTKKLVDILEKTNGVPADKITAIAKVFGEMKLEPKGFWPWSKPSYLYALKESFLEMKGKFDESQQHAAAKLKQEQEQAVARAAREQQQAKEAQEQEQAAAQAARELQQVKEKQEQVAAQAKLTEELKATQVKLEQQIATLGKQVGASQKLLVAETENQGLQTQVNTLEQECEVLCQQNGLLATEIQQNDLQISSLQKEQEDLTQQNVALKAEESSFDKDIESVNDENAKAIRNLNLYIPKLRARKEELENELNKLFEPFDAAHKDAREKLKGKQPKPSDKLKEYQGNKDMDLLSWEQKNKDLRLKLNTTPVGENQTAEQQASDSLASINQQPVASAESSNSVVPVAVVKQQPVNPVAKTDNKTSEKINVLSELIEITQNMLKKITGLFQADTSEQVRAEILAEAKRELKSIDLQSPGYDPMALLKSSEAEKQHLSSAVDAKLAAKQQSEIEQQNLQKKKLEQANTISGLKEANSIVSSANKEITGLKLQHEKKITQLKVEHAKVEEPLQQQADKLSKEINVLDSEIAKFPKLKKTMQEFNREETSPKLSVERAMSKEKLCDLSSEISEGKICWEVWKEILLASAQAEVEKNENEKLEAKLAEQNGTTQEVITSSVDDTQSSKASQSDAVQFPAVDNGAASKKNSESVPLTTQPVVKQSNVSSVGKQSFWDKFRRTKKKPEEFPAAVVAAPITVPAQKPIEASVSKTLNK